MKQRIGRVLSCAILAVAFSSCGKDKPSAADAGYKQWWELEDLEPEEGIAVRVPPFTVEAGHESQRCYFFEVPDINEGGDVWIERINIGLNPGSHHMSVFRVRSIINMAPEDGEPVNLGTEARPLEGTVIDNGDYHVTKPCWDSGNWADWPLMANSQVSDTENPYLDWQLPEDVAIRLEPGEFIMVQTHFVNATDQETTYGASVGINMYKHEKTEATQELGTLFATQQGIRICQSTPDVTFSGTCRFPTEDKVTITAANGHFHSRGKEFEIFTWDGQSIQEPSPEDMFYYSDSWDEPPMDRDLGVVTGENAGIWWNCRYNWKPPVDLTCDDVNTKDIEEGGAGDDCCYTFGGNTDVGEHCNVFLYYYPKVETDVFCN